MAKTAQIVNRQTRLLAANQQPAVVLVRRIGASVMEERTTVVINVGV